MLCTATYVHVTGGAWLCNGGEWSVFSKGVGCSHCAGGVEDGSDVGKVAELSEHVRDERRRAW